MTPRDVLARIPLFGVVLDASALDALVAAGHRRQFRKHDVLMRQGEAGTSMFVLLDGKVEVTVHERSGDQPVATLSAGDIVGEMSLITGAWRSATVTAATRVEALEIESAALSAVLARSPELIPQLAHMISEREEELRQIHQDVERWYSRGYSRDELTAQITEHFGH
jgi:CRP-like cAMP-binding protein